MAYDKITDPPKNVKEAIDWLIRIGELDNKGAGQPNSANARDIEKAIKALTGSGSNSIQNAIKGLIQGLAGFLDYKSGQINGGGIIKNGSNGNYTSAYEASAQWPTCKPGGNCSCCTNNPKCQCTASSTKSCNGSCCHRCDIRICAGIFVALVPALHTALDGLKDKLKNQNGKTIKDMKDIFTALGYQESYLNEELPANQASNKLRSAINKLGDLKRNISNAFMNNTGRSTQNGFRATDKSISTSSSTSTSSPRTIREMLLWLMGLPYCQGYQQFVDELKKKKDVLGPTGRNNEYHLHRQLSAVIFHLPTVFYSIEARISYLKEIFEQFKKDDAKPRFHYPSDGDQFLKTLSAYVAVCYPILKYLMQRCDRDDKGRVRRDARGPGSPTQTAEENDGSWGNLLVSGNENNTAQVKSSDVSGSTVPQTALKDYLVFMGFQTDKGTVTGDQLYDNALKECFSESVKNDDEDEEKAVTSGAGTGTRLPRSLPAPRPKKYEKLPALRKLAKKVLQEAYSPSGGSSSPTTTPSTIRQMMLWLIGLPLTEAYKSNGNSLFGTGSSVLTGINQNQALMKLEKQSGRRGHSTSTTGKHFKQQLKDSIVGMIMLFQRIEGGVHSVVEFLKGGFKDGGGGSSAQPFQYNFENDNGGGTNGKTIFTEFSTYVYKVHVQLRFLKVMCKTGKDHGGWSECQYDPGSGVGYNTGSWTCTCCSSVFDSGACRKPLRNFLKGNGDNKFQLCNDKKTEHLQMGFKAYEPQSSTSLFGNSQNLTGSHIYDFLKELIDPIDTSQPTPTPKPLSLLTQYCVAIGPLEPQSLGDHFDVFRELANGMWKKIQTQVKGDIKQITTTDQNGETASENLKTALKEVWPGTHNGTHPSDLVSLTGCNDGNNCTPFIASLSYGLYKYCDPEKQLYSVAHRINWLYMKMSSLYGKLTTLKTEMETNCKCCPKGNPKPSQPCPGITQCPNCLPQLYKMGLVFGSAEKLSVKSGAKKCRDLHTKMTAVLQATSKLCVVFTRIETGRFRPYLLFASSVVEKNKEKFSKGTDGDENYNCYTKALGGEYKDTYLKDKKKEDKSAAETKKTEREGALMCTCTKHEYSELKVTPKNPIIVTLTLYFKSTHITQTISLTVPFHGPANNPLVRFYPRNLKSIVDWLLRIGQTRLGQNTSEASTEGKGVEEMCKTLWPRIQGCVSGMDQDVFKQLVEKVMSLMGLENKGKTEVGEEVEGKLEAVKKKITDKLNGSGDGFQATFKSILTFNPKNYIDKVIEDFGQKVYDVNKGSVSKRSFECIAKSVTKCMEQSLDKIKKLAQDNNKKMQEYNVTIEDLNESIEEVTELKTINDLKQLCEGFQKFHTVYKTVSGAFTGHLNTAQSSTGQEHWTNINKCVLAFNELGKCVDILNTLNGYTGPEDMTQAKEKLGELSQKLQGVHEKLSVGGIEQFSEKVDEFIKKLDDEQLKTAGETALAEALQIQNHSSKPFSELLKYYVSELIDKMKKNSIGDNNNTSCDIHLRVRNDLLQLSECLKVMCEVCSTGMKDFAEELQKAVDGAKEKLWHLRAVQDSLQRLKNHLNILTSNTSTSDPKKLEETTEWSIRGVRRLLESEYIYQTQPIVSTFITQDDVNKMTKYLKSLPDLIRDRYVLQKWKDSPEDFCGVQEFKGGIVKQSGIEGIKEKLKELLEDTYHNATSVTIHTFQVRALIYNFCHKEAMEKIQVGLEVISGVKDVLQNGVEWTNISGKKDKLSPLLTKLSTNPYLKYFASHLRDSVGYHTLSNTLGALEQVKEKLGESNGSSQPSNWSEISKLLQKTVIDQLHDRLQSLVDQLNREYIFEYPPFDWQKSCKRLVTQATASRARRSADGSPSPSSTTCDMCAPSMAYIFIGFVPQMYRLFKMLREMTKVNGYGHQHTLVYSNNGTDAVNKCVSSLAGLLSREGWRLKDGNDSDDEAFDLDASKTGTEICKFLESIITDTPTGVLLAQKGDASTANASLKPLDKLFKAVMQHFRTKRDEKKTQREQELEKEFQEKYKDSGLKFLAPLPQLPSTVRQVLFWLHELDTNKAFYDAMSQHIKALCQRSTIGISHDTILHVLKLSITQCLEVLATIEDPGRHTPQYYYDLYTEEHYYDYPTVNIPLFFYTFVEKLMGAYLELNFVCVQCEFRALEGGWSECHIGKGTMELPKIIAEHECLCKKTTVQGSTDSRLPLNSFSYSSATAAICPRPLYSFLFGENTLKAPAEKKAYMSKGTMPCGFQLKNKAITDPATPSPAPTPHAPAPTSVSGSVLVEPLRKLVGGHVKGRLDSTSTRNDENNTLSTVIYLRDLLRYTLCLAVRPPWSMSENMAFFYRVTESWKQKGVGGVTVAQGNAELLAAIHKEIALFPGTFDGKLLTTAVERFAGIEDNNKHQNSAVSPTSSHHYDLRTLMGCQETNTPGTSASGSTIQCSPFMFPLALDVYTHYNEKNSRAYLSWILNFAFGIYAQLKALEEMIKEKECAMNASKGAPSTCPSLPMCPGVLSALYQSGSSFMDQRKLAKNTSTGSATTKKTCNDFHTVLTGLFNCDTSNCTPLHNLIVQCEAFLWSIRLPFSLVQLSLWSVAILFISYVFVVPLDHFKIKSHLFNRLKYTMHPSLLIADQQRRVSEVAYFSL